MNLPRSCRRLRVFLFGVAAVLFSGAVTCRAETRTSNMWWYPKAVTVHGHDIDRLLMAIFWLTLAVFIATQVVYVWFLVKYRYRKGVKAVYSHGNNRLEIIWTAIPAVIFVVLAILSNRLWLQLRTTTPKDALKIDIMAYQFGFHIRNPGVDQTLGNYNLELVSKENYFGQKRDDSKGFDDYQSENQFTIPVHTPVNVLLRSMDVIHAFYIPEFRVYQDMVPGHEIDWMWFEAEQTGHYAIACNQLCGGGHYNMQAKVDVVSKEDYAKLVAEKSQAALKNHEEKAKQDNTAQQDASPTQAVSLVTAH